MPTSTGSPARSTSASREARWRHRLLIPACCALVMGTAAGCGSTGGSTAAAGSSANTTGNSAPISAPGATGSSSDVTGSPTQPVVMIHNFSYQTPTVSPGQTVGVMNMDSEAHTLTADTGDAFDVKATPGTTVTFTAPSKPGSYAFHCTYHSNMHGVLVVK